jgi:hypothetical protein
MDDQIADVRDLGAGVLRVRVVDVVARAVHQRLVARDVLLLVRRVLLAVDLEPACVRQRVLLVVVPEDLAGVVLPVGVDQEDAAGDRVEVRVTLDGDRTIP